MTLKEENKQEDRLLERAIFGERAGLEYLVNKYRDLAYAVAIKIVLNKEDAEEVVQDSFMKAFASLRKFKRASKFSTWLYRIVYNTALTKIGSRRIEIVDLSDQYEAGGGVVIENQQFELLKNEEQKKYIELALRNLAKEDYLIISLHYIGEKSIMEICEILDMKKSAVKMRLLRGRQQLHIELKRLLNTEIKNLL
jgi:RNA polymerase sigma-70 factor (ECF subfamily)